MATDGDASHGASGRTQAPGQRVAQIQRAQLPEGLNAFRRSLILDAVVEIVAERGVAGASVGLVCARAKVSRNTFYECYDGLDECLIAVLDGALERATPLVVDAFGDSVPTHPWQDGMRKALAAMLAFFDEEPALARVCLVDLGAAGPVVRAHRERILAAFSALVLERIGGEISHPSPLAAEGTYASVVGIVNARLVGDERGPLLGLLGPLMGIVVAPFVEEAEIEREVRRGNELAQAMLEQRSPPAPDGAELPVRVPDVLLSARAHRARRCLQYVVEQGARGLSPSNQEVGAGIGVPHRGQVTKLLDRLAALGLLEKRSGRPGHPNAWSATHAGEKIASLLSERDAGSERPQ